MKKVYSIISYILIAVSVTIILNSILNHDEHLKVLINVIMIVVIITMAILAVVCRIIYDKIHN